MPSPLTAVMSYLLTAALGVLLIGATVVGIVTASDHSQRPSVGTGQDRSAVVLYGGR
ncbi:MAG: DUF2613 family protein [Jatrophihabitantaceae bacterium]